MKLLFLSCLLLIGFNIGCSSLQATNYDKIPVYREHVFYGTYEKIWKATEKAVSNYSLAANNIESGIIQTDWVRGDRVWSPPDSKKIPNFGMRERITVYLTKGHSQGNPSVKVQVKKELELHKDFVMEPEIIPSDGLEELVILYRLERETEIAHAIANVDSKSKMKQKKDLD